MLETFLLSIQTGVGWWIWEVDKGKNTKDNNFVALDYKILVPVLVPGQVPGTRYLVW